MYREIFQMGLSEFHSTVWEKSPKVSTKSTLLCCMAIIALFVENFPKKFSPCRHLSKGAYGFVIRQEREYKESM